MSQATKELRLVVVNPGDVDPQRLRRVKDEANEYLRCIPSPLRLNLQHWRSNVIPGFDRAGNTQTLIEEQLDLENAEVVIGIFGHRFGASLDDSGVSPTAREILKQLTLM